MKRYTQILGLFAAVMFFTSCDSLLNREVEPVSQVSIKPYVKLLGEPIMSITKGTNYVEHGIQASIESEDGNELGYTITAGEVDPNTNGFYAVEYYAANEFGWGLYTYRSVLVYEGDPYAGNAIGGEYKFGFLKRITITEHDIPGYWVMPDIWAAPGVEFPVIFAGTGLGTFAIVPGEHSELGNYRGTVEITDSSLSYVLEFIQEDGSVKPQSGSWIRL